MQLIIILIFELDRVTFLGPFFLEDHSAVIRVVVDDDYVVFVEIEGSYHVVFAAVN